MVRSFGSVYSLWGGVFVFTLSFFPFITLIALSGFKGCDPSLEEAGLLSRGSVATVFRISLPLIGPHIFTGAILVFVFTVINFEVPDILRINVYPTEIFIHFSAFYDEKAAAILSLPLVILSLMLIGIQAIYMRRKKFTSLGRQNQEEPLFSLYGFNLLFFLSIMALIAVSVFIPGTALIWKSGGPVTWMAALEVSHDQIFYSIYVSTVSALLITGFSFPVAWYLTRNKGIACNCLDYLLQLPFGIPSVSLGIGLIYIWNRKGIDWIYDSTGILVIAFVTAYSPFVIKIISSRIQQIRCESEDAGILGNGSVFLVLLKIVLPLSAPGLLMGFFIGFVLSLFNLGTALLVVPPGKSTLPVTIYNFLHYGAKEMVFAQSLILVTIALLVGLLLYPLYKVCIARSKLLL